MENVEDSPSRDRRLRLRAREVSDRFPPPKTTGYWTAARADVRDSGVFDLYWSRFYRLNRFPLQPKTLRAGGMAEWLKAHAWKACVRQKRTVGSNPTPSAMTRWQCFRTHKTLINRPSAGRVRIPLPPPLPFVAPCFVSRFCRLWQTVQRGLPLNVLFLIFAMPCSARRLRSAAAV